MMKIFHKKLYNYLKINKIFLEIGPGTGVLTKYLIKKDTDFSLIEIDSECINFLISNYPKTKNKILEIDFLKLNLANNFPKKLV